MSEEDGIIPLITSILHTDAVSCIKDQTGWVSIQVLDSLHEHLDYTSVHYFILDKRLLPLLDWAEYGMPLEAIQTLVAAQLQIICVIIAMKSYGVNKDEDDPFVLLHAGAVHLLLTDNNGHAVSR